MHELIPNVRVAHERLDGHFVVVAIVLGGHWGRNVMLEVRIGQVKGFLREGDRILSGLEVFELILKLERLVAVCIMLSANL